VFLAALLVYGLGRNAPDLDPWHTERLEEEFDLDKSEEITSFADYLELEDRLFTELDQEIYSQTPSGQGYELARYSSGSMADPRQFPRNWNRSFELSHPSPSGGVLLLHGMSDSPYSLRALAQRFNKDGYWVVGLRLPGHGTAPSGLRYIAWEDLAEAVRLAMSHLHETVGNQPVHMVGYSTGAPLAINYTLDSLEANPTSNVASLILVSPAISVHPAAGLAKVKNWLSIVPGLAHFAWLSVDPEFDPYKYNSFATNAGTQVHRLTRSVNGRIAGLQKAGKQDSFPPVLVFKSTVDATVSVSGVIQNLLQPLGDNGHELVLFDINRNAVKSTLLITDPGPLTSELMGNQALPFTITLVENENNQTHAVQLRSKPASAKRSTPSAKLNLDWPPGVISLSHVALPFPPDDPLYGQVPPADHSRLFLGQMAIQGEHGLLKISTDWLLRLRHNPFYSYVEERAAYWLQDHSGR
jgi:alpha-beta hydrolase superfamily lysophospholipase